MKWICRRWPGVAKALLIEPKVKEASKDEAPQISQPGQPIGSQPVSGPQQHMEELRDEARAVVAATPAENELPIDGAAWASLVFFLANLTVCVLWYAFMYDSTGTVNPSWTDVFG